MVRDLSALGGAAWAARGLQGFGAAGRSGGRRLRICFSGGVAPAEPPITMISRLLMEPVFDCVVLQPRQVPVLCSYGADAKAEAS